jgi:hypothetical protein
MRLESAQDLKSQLLSQVVEPIARHAARVRTAGARALAVPVAGPGLEADASLLGMGARPFDTVPEVQRSLALGVARRGTEYRLAIRLQRAALRDSPIVEHLKRQAKGEVDIRLVGRIDKRGNPPRAASRRGPLVNAAAAGAWYRANTRPLLIGASVGHFRITAGTLGAFVDREGAVCMLSNNHVLANEDAARAGDAILQRARSDGGRRPADAVARLSRWVRLKRRGSNLVDAALATLKAGQSHDPRLLRELVGGKDRKLKGLGPEFIDEGDSVYKVGRTTGASKGRVTAFDLDNVVVNYDAGNLRFDGQIEIEGVGTKPFSDGGDSGSLIVNSRMEAVALLFAGSDTGGRNGAGLTYANPIHRVLEDLKATLLS